MNRVFQKALKNLKGKNTSIIFSENPNNWTSFFSGSAWNYYPENEEYALHLSRKNRWTKLG
jgi:oligo-1,6-glucosidase